MTLTISTNRSLRIIAACVPSCWCVAIKLMSSVINTVIFKMEYLTKLNIYRNTTLYFLNNLKKLIFSLVLQSNRKPNKKHLQAAWIPSNQLCGRFLKRFRAKREVTHLEKHHAVDGRCYWGGCRISSPFFFQAMNVLITFSYYVLKWNKKSHHNQIDTLVVTGDPQVWIPPQFK